MAIIVLCICLTILCSVLHSIFVYFILLYRCTYYLLKTLLTSTRVYVRGFQFR